MFFFISDKLVQLFVIFVIGNNRLRFIVIALIDHDKRYYDETKPVISDYEYDKKLHQLIAYEKEHPDQIDPNSPTLRVSESPTEGFIQREHLIPMYSLANTYSEEEVDEFVKRVHKLLEKK